jgi:hypothetical protein
VHGGRRESILAEAEERLERRYDLKSKSYDLKSVERRIEEIIWAEGRAIYSRGRRRDHVDARNLFCY